MYACAIKVQSLNVPMAQGGRPSLPVNKEQLVFLRSINFTWADISTILGPSVQIVLDVIRQFPNAGEAMLTGHLLSLGIHVQREKLRLCILRVRGHSYLPPRIYRRTYSVPGPNYLWHTDGNHKLIRYRMAIHGIDRFSRLITY